MNQYEKKYNLKMVGLKKAAGETKFLNGWNGAVQIGYDRKSGEIFTNYVVGENYVVYHDPAVIFVSREKFPASMELIAWKIDARKRYVDSIESMKGDE